MNPDMELGNMLFGYSRGEFQFPDRELVDSDEWSILLKITQSDQYGITDDSEHANSRGGFENEMFAIRPYWWGDEDNEEEAMAANFVYKPAQFEIRWYKYPFRDSYMNQNLTADELKMIWAICKGSVADTLGLLN